ncbi:hypothetical protein FRX31_033023 [Thalictrum thalictroides]|uniref:C2H2-type domain-containing protein n=1 Tax=Thalictrum thalictroides TaxID=46969 RepID=A0A7J6UZA3_THATH|nr:hypothetical protein FRX31_033023 [Thalictrum thalictroides]
MNTIECPVCLNTFNSVSRFVNHWQAMHDFLIHFEAVEVGPPSPPPPPTFGCREEGYNASFSTQE